MNIMRVCFLAATLLLVGLIAPFSGPLPARAREYTSAQGALLTGELVITDAARNRFRLVGHGGSFTAPAGTPVEAFDGKPVEVEFARDGRVLQITTMPIRIEPIAHGFEVVSGQLVVMDAGMRRFTIAGDDRIYVAPFRVDVGLYAGRMVEVRLDEQGQVMDITPAIRAGDAPLASTCAYEGQGYSDGTSLCQSGTQFRCERGQWRNLGTACVSSSTTVSRSSRTCMVGGASVAGGSSICRGGMTFRCVDGEWVNVWTACS